MDCSEANKLGATLIEDLWRMKLGEKALMEKLKHS